MTTVSPIHHTSPVSLTRPPQPFILVVDDEPANLSLLKEALSSTGLKIRVVTNGLKAIELAQKNRPSLILLDVSMPGIDGFETCQRLKADENTADIPIIFATAFSEVEQKVKAFSLGAVDYITKPFHVEEVLARVKVQLSLQTLTLNLQSKNRALEQEIQARFSAEQALTQSNQQLQESLEQLQKTQVQLIQSEKMSSLGQMMAGIAHEMNNPVGFIYGNIKHLKQSMLGIFNLLDQYATEYPADTPAIAQIKEELDLDFLKADLPKILNSINVGLRRIQDILASMGVFSRLNEAERKEVDIEQGIDSVLLVLNRRLQVRANHPAINIIKDYGGLPPFECYPGELNQVLLHILANAIDALDAQTADPTAPMDIPTITLRTAIDNGQAMIHISDNGVGIPDDIQSKIFDPFFTTKPVGKGKGLGLSIAHQIIVEQHSGTLNVVSALHKGTTFSLSLPIP